MNERYLTVSALTKYIKRKMESDRHLKQVFLKAEISNFKQHSRGHMYLTLKDDRSRIQAVMFAGYNRNIKFTPEDGMNVLVQGEISVYEPHGQYQLYIHDMQPDGVGALYQAYEELKNKLEKEGLFDEERKKPLPKFPHHIGVITSPTGAAVRDIITTLNRRYPSVSKTIFPVLVQGEYAAPSIVKAIQQANLLGGIDILIVGRGGGSIEELWAFNEESVARAIAHSNIPIISAVGHETDFTISDFVADLRAPTPTGAAELAVPSQKDVLEKILTLQKRLHQAMNRKYTKSQDELKHLQKSYAFRYPAQLLKQKEQELDRLYEQLIRSNKNYLQKKQDRAAQLNRRLIQQHPEKQISLNKTMLGNLQGRYQRSMKQLTKQKQIQFDNVLDKLSLLNPLEIMKRGYAIPFSSNQAVIKSVRNVQPGDQINIKVQDGTIDCHVFGIEEEDKDV